MAENAPRAGGGNVNSAGADAVARVEDLQAPVAGAGSAVGSDDPAATVEVGVADEGSGQATVSPALPLAEETGAAPPPVVASESANGGGRERGAGGLRGWQKWLFCVGMFVVGIIDFYGLFIIIDSIVSPAPCSPSSFDMSTIEIGKCMEWEGGSRGLVRFLPGVKAKSRLTVVEGGGTYMGPDGVKVPLEDILDEHQDGGGLLCDVERLVLRIAGIREGPHKAKMIRSQLVVGTGAFCRTHSTPLPFYAFAKLRLAGAYFSETGHLQIVSVAGTVMWSSDNDVMAAGGSDVGVGKFSKTKGTGSRGNEGSNGTKKRKERGRRGAAATRG